MGSAYHIKIARTALTDEEFERVKFGVDAALREVNRQMSHYQPDSELSRFNRSDLAGPSPLSSNFAHVVRFAIDLYQRSGGAFDPTLDPLINLWGFGRKGETLQVPAEAQIRETMKICGCQHLQVTGSGELRKSIPQLQLNLSAVAKGFGVDEAVRVIRRHGVTNVFVEVGGEVATSGLNPRGEKWRVGIEAPIPNAAFGTDIAAIVPISGQALATSGDYRRFFQDAQGRRFSHILDPQTGRPVQHNLVSVSVVAPNCLVADGLATTLFVLGPEKGLPWIEKWPDAAALFITREADGRLRSFASARFPEWINTASEPSK